MLPEPACLDYPPCIGLGCGPLDFTQVSPIPEASTYLMFVFGLAAMALYVRFRKR